MNKLKRLHIIELFICLIVCAAPFAWSYSHVQNFVYSESLFVDDLPTIDHYFIHNGVETVEVKEFCEDVADGKFYLKHYDMPNGDTVVSGSLRGETKEAVVLQKLHLQGNATIHYYKNGVVEKEALREGHYNPSLFLIDSRDFDIACYTPKQYTFCENDALEYLPEKDGYLKVTKAGDGFDIELITDTVKEDSCSDFMLIYSKEDLMDWTSADLDNTWLTISMDGDNRWTYSGFYRISPGNYVPTGPNIYFRCQACYLAGSIIKMDAGYRVLDDMLCCITDVMANQQNEIGFFPSTSKSLWLYNDFGIEENYYDTRFNSDLMEIFLTCYRNYGNNVSYFAMQKYIDFFVEYTNTYGIDDGKGGIYVPDYWHVNSDSKNVPTSLNHQLSEINVLYQLSRELGRPDLIEVADRMLKAIENTGLAWLKYDGSFEYAIYPDGSFGLNDYDTLTYNDMFKLQRILTDVKGQRNELIDQLMESKLIWMINRNVTDYLQ